MLHLACLESKEEREQRSRTDAETVNRTMSEASSSNEMIKMKIKMQQE